MEKLVLTGTVCFCVGLTVGLILGAVVMALAATAKKYKPTLYHQSGNSIVVPIFEEMFRVIISDILERKDVNVQK